MSKITLKLTGVSPMLMSCDTMANPLDERTKAHKVLNMPKVKTDELLLALAKSSWSLSMYWDDKLGPFMPTQNIRACFIRGATLAKLGTAFKRSIIMAGDKEPVEYGAHYTKQELWDKGFVDARTVVQGGKNRIMSYRPKFENWTVTCTLNFDEQALNPTQILVAATAAGSSVGLGGYRVEKGGPFGRFTVEQVGPVVPN